MEKLQRSDITPEHIYLNRRKFMVGIGSVATVAALAACGMPPEAPSDAGAVATEAIAQELDFPEALAYDEPYASAATDELGDPLNKYRDITEYNN